MTPAEKLENANPEPTDRPTDRRTYSSDLNSPFVVTRKKMDRNVIMPNEPSNISTNCLSV